MISKIISCGLQGIDGYILEVETDISYGMPSFDIVGLGDAAVRESRERVRAAIRNIGFEFPARRITVNLAPASLKKEGSYLDLPVAIGILSASGYIEGDFSQKYAFAGELSLDGKIKPFTGALSMASCFKDNGFENLFLPAENAEEAAVVNGIKVFPVDSLDKVIAYFNGHKIIDKCNVNIDSYFNSPINYTGDFNEVRGQENTKRAIEIAVSGGHNCLMVGSPGSGKTMLARRIPSIMPPLSFEEAMTVTKIHSISGILSEKVPLITKRPFRSPHHTVSPISLVGGGKYPKPGEVSLAHKGVLFLDELAEFPSESLEVLRQPLEDGFVTITRVNATITYPSDCMLIAASNPCPCGRYLENEGTCRCTSNQVKHYISKLSGPLLDRLDIHIETPPVDFGTIDEGINGESSEIIQKRVLRTRNIQGERYKNESYNTNSQMKFKDLEKNCVLDKKTKSILKLAFNKMGLSARGYTKILKIARTIADMDLSDMIKEEHIAEAIQYRNMDRKLWGVL